MSSTAGNRWYPVGCHNNWTMLPNVAQCSHNNWANVAIIIGPMLPDVAQCCHNHWSPNVKLHLMVSPEHCCCRSHIGQGCDYQHLPICDAICGPECPIVSFRILVPGIAGSLPSKCPRLKVDNWKFKCVCLEM